MRHKFHILLCVSFFSFLLFSSCFQSKTIKSNTKTSKTFTYLALGDSYTIGESVDIIDRWPNQLETRLAEKGFMISDVDIIAKTGWTTADLLGAIENQKPVSHDIVSLLIGVNNQYQGLSFEEFNSEFDSLLEVAINLSKLGKDRVFVVSIPDYGLTPFVKDGQAKIAMELDQYNGYMEEKCKELSIPFVNITSVSRSLAASPSAIADDGLHPSGYQYSQWVNEILPVAISLLSK